MTARAGLKLKGGETLNEQTLVQTGFNSYAVIKVGDNLLTVYPLTRISVEKFSSEQGGEGKTYSRTALYVDMGKAQFKVNSSRTNLNEFKVYMAASVSSVRGTDFTVYANETAAEEGLVGVDRGGVDRSAIPPLGKGSIPDRGPITGFTRTEGPDGGKIPLFEGCRIVIDDMQTVTTFQQRMLDAVSLPGDSSSLADKANVTGIPFVESNSGFQPCNTYEMENEQVGDYLVPVEP